MQKVLNVGMVGYKFMGKAHSHAYAVVPKFFQPAAVPVMKAICGLYPQEAEAAAKTFGWEGYETDWRRLVERKDIDLIDISTPTDSHRDIAVAAAENGKHIFCEKPMAINLAEAKEMLQAATKAGVQHLIGFNYRRVPAIALAKKLIDEGRLGRIFHWRAVYLQDWIVNPDFPRVWRLEKAVAGSGSLGDLGAHIADLALFLVGDIASVSAVAETFIKERPLPTAVTGLTATGGKEKGKVDVDDAVIFMAKFKNGALGSFEVTRFATGRKNYNCFEINGSKGTIAFNLERLNELQFLSQEDDADSRGFRNIMVTEPTHPYVAAWWPPGHVLGWEASHINEVADLCDAIGRNVLPSPSFADGVKNQAVLEAAARSMESGKWEEVPR